MWEVVEVLRSVQGVFVQSWGQMSIVWARVMVVGLERTERRSGNRIHRNMIVGSGGVRKRGARDNT